VEPMPTKIASSVLLVSPWIRPPPESPYFVNVYNKGV
jgi:hypothetical protein